MNERILVNSGDRKVTNYTRNTPVKITKGSLTGCEGRIAGCTVDGVYFIRLDRCKKEADCIYRSIDLFLTDEFEPLN